MVLVDRRRPQLSGSATGIDAAAVQLAHLNPDPSSVLEVSFMRHGPWVVSRRVPVPIAKEG